MAQFERPFPTEELVGVTNYYSRGRRGKRGISVKHMEIDSEGDIWSYYTDGTDENIGHIPSGPAGKDGEPGKDGVVQDVLVNGVSVLDGAIAKIITSEGGATVNIEAGDNVEVTKAGDTYTISAIDTTYTAGTNITISATNEIASKDLMLDTLVVTQDVGGYRTGDVIEKDTPIEDVIKTLLGYSKPTPVTSDYYFYGSTKQRPATTIESTWTQKPCTSDLKRDPVDVTINASRAYMVFAYPASYGPLKSIKELPDATNKISVYDASTAEFEGQTYQIYASNKTSGTFDLEYSWS